MKILIVGSEGFIGRHLVKHFSGNGWQVHGTDLADSPSQAYAYTRASRSTPDFQKLFSPIFDACVNASGSANVSYSVSNPIEDFEANTLDNLRLLEAIRKFAPSCKYLHISSAAVYGNPSRLPVREEDPPMPLSPYGWHKWMAEQQCTEYSRIYGLKTAKVRIFSAYGPGLRKQLFWELYNKSQSAQGTVELWGTGSESRDFIFISDIVEALRILCEKAEMNGEVYNLASGTETTVREAADHFFKAVKPSVSFRFNQKVRAGDPLNWKADISKIKKLGFDPKIRFHEGIEKLAQWLKNPN